MKLVHRQILLRKERKKIYGANAFLIKFPLFVMRKYYTFDYTFVFYLPDKSCLLFEKSECEDLHQG